MQVGDGRHKGAHQRIIDLPCENLALLHAPYPICQSSIEDDICDNGPKRPILGSVPAELVIGIECYACDNDGGVSQCESDVCEEMRLLEFEGSQVIGQGVVCGIFQIWIC